MTNSKVLLFSLLLVTLSSAAAEYTCPPSVVSSSTEAWTLCEKAGISSFESSSGEYTCSTGVYGNLTAVCTGTIDEKKDILTTCSIPTVASCAKTDLYNSNFALVGSWTGGDVTDGSGPCESVGTHGSFWDSFECDKDEGKFSCFDASLGEWCKGSVSGTHAPTSKPTIPADLNYTCPPETVHSYAEANYYCGSSGLDSTGGTGNGGVGSYSCDWPMNGVEACSGKIDPKNSNTPECSATVASCDTDDLRATVCADGSSTFLRMECDQRTRKFECFDKTLNQWCTGSIDGTASPTVHPTKSPTSAPTINATTPEMSNHTRPESWNAVLIVAGGLVGIGLLIVFLMKLSRKIVKEVFFFGGPDSLPSSEMTPSKAEIV